MVRPRKQRHIQGEAHITYFKPAGIPLRDIEEIELTHDQWEALRLIDAQNTAHKEAAAIMNISPATLSRLLAAARNTVATSITEGKALRIDGGDYKVVNQGRGKGPCGGGQGRRNGQGCGNGRGQGRKNGQGCGAGQGKGRGRGMAFANSAVADTNSETQGENTTMTDTINLVAVSTSGTDINATIEPRFGRAPGFVLVNLQDMSSSHLDNSTADSMGHGAGIATAEKIANAKVDLVLTGRVGPKAAAALDAAKVAYIEDCGGMSVKDAIAKHCNDKA